MDIPYNGTELHHTANLRILDTVSNTSDITERHFAGQFTRWTIQIELQDGFLFSIPYKQNWRIADIDIEIIDKENLETEHVINLEEMNDIIKNNNN